MSDCRFVVSGYAHGKHLENITECPYCRITELEQQLAHKQEQCDQLAHEVLALELNYQLLSDDYLAIKDSNDRLRVAVDSLSMSEMAVELHKAQQQIAYEQQRNTNNVAMVDIRIKELEQQLSRYKAGVEINGVLKFPEVIPNITIWLSHDADMRGFNDGQQVRIIVLPEEKAND